MKDDKNNKIISIESAKEKAQEIYEDRLTLKLLEHMRAIRDSIPVNYKLQQELKQVLFERNYQKDRANFKISKERFYMKYIAAVICITALIVLAVFILQKSKDELIVSEIPRERMWVWADEYRDYELLNRDLLVLTEEAILVQEEEMKPNHYKKMLLPAEWEYLSIAVSAESNTAVLSRRALDSVQIVKLDIDKLYEGESMSEEDICVLLSRSGIDGIYDLALSACSKKLAYVEVKNNVQRVCILDMEEQEPMYIADGSYPTWMQDLSFIIQRGSKERASLYLVDLETNQTLLIGEGMWPYWQSGRLYFTSIVRHERVLTFMPDGRPEFSVCYEIGEVRYIDADDGCELLEKVEASKNLILASQKLFAPNIDKGHVENKWLQELKQKKEVGPKVLLLNKLNYCMYPKVSHCEGELIYIKEQGFAASIMSANIFKAKRGGR